MLQNKARSFIKILSYGLLFIVITSPGKGKGDIHLAGLFPIHTPSTQSKLDCSDNVNLYGFQAYQAMVYAIDRINANDAILPNITLRGVYFDTCANPSITARYTRDVVNMKIRMTGDELLVGVVGAARSDISAKVANILQVFETPQISYASTSVVLSNKDEYSYFLRTVASDSYQVQALVDICLEFGWTYIMTVNSEGIYGTMGIKGFTELAHQNHICTDHIATVTQITAEESEFDDIVRTVVERSHGPGTTVVLLFCGMQHSKGIVRAAQRNKDATGLIWIASDTWDRSVTDFEDIDILAIGLLKPNTSQDYIDYFESLDVGGPEWESDGYLRDFWQQVFHCSLNNTSSGLQKCTGNESLRDPPFQITEVHSVINAVNAFAQSLDEYQKEVCPNMTGICRRMDRDFRGEYLMRRLMEISFPDSLNNTMRFNKEGEVEPYYAIMKFRKTSAKKREYVQIGTWKRRHANGSKSLRMDHRLIRWSNAGADTPESFCSAACPFGSVKKPRTGYNFTCCWTCQACTKLQIIRNNTCVDVPIGYVPTKNRTAWVKRELVYLKWHDELPMFLLTVSAIGLLLTIITLAVFIVFYENRTVKACGREASFIILAGILLSFINPFLYIARPSDALCYARKLCVGLALAMIYSSVFMKVNRVYRIFQSAKSSARRPALVRPKSQVLITLGLISIQLLFVSLWLVISPTHAVEEYYVDEEELHLECNMKSVNFAGSQIYVIVLMILCTVYAFKTRKFPKNFNESKYIGITLYTICVVSTLFLAFFLNARDKFTENLLIAGVSIIWGFISLIGLFGQRIYLILFLKEDVMEHTTTLTQGVEGNTPPTRDNEITHIPFKRKTKVSDSSTHGITILNKCVKKRASTI